MTNDWASWFASLTATPKTLKEKRKIWNAQNYQRNRQAILDKKKAQRDRRAS